MITMTFTSQGKQPLYQQLYIHIRECIIQKKIQAGEKLPSKRKLATHLQLSNSTVENAYAQLIAEGYILAKEKKGYYACLSEPVGHKIAREKIPKGQEESITNPFLDLRTNVVDTESFPFSVWTRLTRESLREKKTSLLESGHPQGDLNLRQEIAFYLKNFRTMNVSPDQIVVGAGMEYLLGLITELVPGQPFAIETPCYPKLPQILKNKKIPLFPIPMDQEGISMSSLEKTKAEIVFLTPSCHFPLGTVTTANRRLQLLNWANQSESRYLIEDDYDSEYRYHLKPIPPLYSLDTHHKVIYLNTFARTLAPSLRIGYMILPESLLTRYHQTLQIYSCTVSRFDQATLQKFMQNDHYERHLHRMKLIYKARRDILLSELSKLTSDFSIQSSTAGLHLIITANNQFSEKIMIQKLLNQGVRVYPLSDYYWGTSRKISHSVLLGFGGIKNDDLRKASKIIVETLNGIAHESP
ncbi:MAG: PLP-dependent aminotransferase family protein [Negativicutes bacterium]|jgi:GntR family transcriptional regulator/MocR family aminotransferase|nr:PLP-dependent aminotransferase family protein [Negativicutes bacterium]